MKFPAVRVVSLGLIVTAFSSLEVEVAAAATRVEIVIDEPFPNRSVPWPVTTGVPFPRGGLADGQSCRLVDDRGQEQPLQSQVAATWDAQGGSVRWLTIDFVAQPKRKYALEFGPAVRRKTFASPLRVAQGDPLRVSTGAVTAEFATSGASALGAICVDLNGDGRIENDEVVASGGAAGDHYYLDGQGRRFSNASDGAGREIVVESRGPVRACVRVDGFYTGPFDTGPNGRRVVRCRTRYHFFAGLGLVKAIDEFQITGSTKGLKWRDIGFALRLPKATPQRVVRLDRDGQPGNQTLGRRWSPSTRAVCSYQAEYRHYGNPQFEAGAVQIDASGRHALSQSDRCGEWMQVADDRSAVTGALRWFWQQFPKEWEATDDSLTLRLWSPRGGELDFGEEGVKRFFGEAGDRYLLNWQGVRSPRNPLENFFYFAGRAALDRGEADGLGLNKHHEFYLHFAPASQAKQGEAYGALAAKQPLALASGAWNCSTDVFGPLAARPNGSKYEAVVDRLFKLSRYGQDTFGDYGWWLFGAGPHYSYQWDAERRAHYADPRRFEFHTYQKETQLWWNYLRSGERQFYDWAIPSENHWVDIAVTHAPVNYRCALARRRAAAAVAAVQAGRLVDRLIHSLPAAARLSRGLAPRRLAVLGLVSSHARDHDAGLLSHRRRALQRRHSILARLLGASGRRQQRFARLARVASPAALVSADRRRAADENLGGNDPRLRAV